MTLLTTDTNFFFLLLLYIKQSNNLNCLSSMNKVKYVVGIQLATQIIEQIPNFACIV